MANAQLTELHLLPTYAAAVASYDTYDLKNASSGAVAAGWVMCMTEHNDTITHVGYRQGTTTGTPASGSYKIGLYTVDGSGLPTATDLGGGSPTEATFQPVSGDDGKFVWVALTNSIQIARGTFFAIVLQNNADTSANGITVAYRGSNYGYGPNGYLPYELTYAASTWTKGSSAFRQPVFACKSSTLAYGYTIISAPVGSAVSTSGNRLALKFTLPAGWGTSFKLLAVRGVFRAGSLVTDSFGFGVWNSAGTLLQGGTYDSGQMNGLGAPGNRVIGFPDTALATLSFGTTYYVGLESVSSSSIAAQLANFTASSDMLAFPLGENACYSTWNGSAWSDTATSRPIVNLILDDITPPSGGGSGVPGNLLGGLFQ